MYIFVHTIHSANFRTYWYCYSGQVVFFGLFACACVCLCKIVNVRNELYCYGNLAFLGWFFRNNFQYFRLIETLMGQCSTPLQKTKTKTQTVYYIFHFGLRKFRPQFERIIKEIHFTKFTKECLAFVTDNDKWILLQKN